METEILFNEKYLPKNDLIFSIMFEDVWLFKKLLKSSTGRRIKANKVFSQASLTPENVLGSYIRFDTFSPDEDDGTLYSMDLQNTYAEELLKNRTIFYAGRALSGQKVIKGDYKKLNKVVVSFIMTQKKNDEPIEIISLYNQKHEKYSDLLTLYKIYVPSVLEHDNMDDDLKVFAAFFSVESYEEMVKFYNDHKNNPLAIKLILSYNKAIGHENIDSLAEKEFFNMKITEQDIAEAKVEYEAKGRTEGEAKGEAKLLKKLVKLGNSIKQLSEMFEIPESEIEGLLALDA